MSQIVAGDTISHDGFGLGVALDWTRVTRRSWAAPFSSPNNTSQAGSAYVFTPGTGTPWSSPAQQIEITGAAENQGVATAGAGTSVAMASDTELVLGFPGAVNKGARGNSEKRSYLPFPAGTWSEAGKLKPRFRCRRQCQLWIVGLHLLQWHHRRRSQSGQ